MELEDADSIFNHDLTDPEAQLDRLDAIIRESLNDFPEDNKSEIAQRAAEIARASRTEQTRTGHFRYRSFYAHML